MSRFLRSGAPCSAGTSARNSTHEQFSTVVREPPQAFRAADPMRPLSRTSGTASSATRAASRTLMLGVHRWPLMTTLELTGYRDWLVQRRRLAQPETFCWTWIQTHLPDWYTDRRLRPTPDAAAFKRAGRAAGRTDPSAGLHGRRLRLPRPGLLVGPLPGRQPHRPRPPAGAGPAQPGTADAGAAARAGP